MLWVTKHVLLAGYQLVEVDCEFYDGQKVRRPASNACNIPLHSHRWHLVTSVPRIADEGARVHHASFIIGLQGAPRTSAVSPRRIMPTYKTLRMP